MNFRFFSLGLLLASLFLLPWWMTALLGMVCMLLFPPALEVVGVALTIDVLFHPKPEHLFFESTFLLTIVSLLFLLFSKLLREKTRFVAY